MPVIASDQEAMVEGVGEAGLVFKRGSVADLTEKLELLFSGKNLAERSARTAERKDEFSHERYCLRLTDILEKIKT